MAPVEVVLYGRLRRHAGGGDVREEAVVRLLPAEASTVAAALDRVGIDAGREVSHVFLNGSLCRDLGRALQAGDRLGVFPRDMGLLYV